MDWIKIRNIGGGLLLFMTLISSVYMGGNFVWTEFAHASDIEDIKKEFKEKQITDLHDKIFIHQFKIDNNTATPLDKALLGRYLNQLETLRR